MDEDEDRRDTGSDAGEAEETEKTLETVEEPQATEEAVAEEPDRNAEVGRRIYVGNIVSASEDEVKEAFSSYGEIACITMMKPRRRGKAEDEVDWRGEFEPAGIS